jgi:hypothetical protein
MLKEMRTVIAMIVLASVIVWFVATNSRPVDSVKREVVMKTLDAEPASSYEQKTNHYPMPSYSMGPMSGFETPFRVNAWHAYME